jgi:hypothetical protein
VHFLLLISEIVSTPYSSSFMLFQQMQNKDKLLLKACAAGNLHHAVLFLQAGADINAKSVSLYTPH